MSGDAISLAEAWAVLLDDALHSGAGEEAVNTIRDAAVATSQMLHVEAHRPGSYVEVLVFRDRSRLRMTFAGPGPGDFRLAVPVVEGSAKVVDDADAGQLPPSDYMTPADAAAALGLSTSTVLHRIRAGRIPSVQVGHRFFVRRADVEALAADGDVARAARGDN